MIDPITVLRAADAAERSGIPPEKLPAVESHPDPPLVCFPLRMDWESTLPPEMEEFPLPVIAGREPTLFGDLLPDSVLKIAEFAREHSWEVRMQYSQGHFPHGITGKPSVLKELIGVRFGAHPMTDRQAYAVYSRNVSGGVWAWSSVMIWGPDLPPYGGCGITELREYLDMPTASGDFLKEWIGRRKTYLEMKDAAMKKRMKDAPKKSANREGMS